MSQNHVLNGLRSSLDFLEMCGGLHKYIVLVSGVMDTSRNPKFMNMMGFGLSLHESRKLLVQNEAE